MGGGHVIKEICWCVYYLKGKMEPLIAEYATRRVERYREEMRQRGYLVGAHVLEVSHDPTEQKYGRIYITAPRVYVGKRRAQVVCLWK